MQRRACVPLAGAVFVVLLCAVGLEGEAQAQFGPPTVANVNPNTGPMQGGTSVTITGTNFSGVTAVRVGSNAAAGSFIAHSSPLFTYTTPARSRRACVPLAGAVFVVLLCAVGLEGEAQAQFGPPTVANVNPNTGPTPGGTSVTITGTNFSGATAV